MLLLDASCVGLVVATVVPSEEAINVAVVGATFAGITSVLGLKVVTYCALTLNLTGHLMYLI